jgi:hypothetical protein
MLTARLEKALNSMLSPENDDDRQGDQIGRILANWAVAYTHLGIL